MSEGKSVFVSGGSKGIGLACAKQLAKEGARVFLAASNEERLTAAADAILKITSPGAVMRIG